MIIKYKLEYSFGPIGSFAGKFAFFSSILGMIFSEFNVFALIFLLIPAFLGFSKTHIYIDTEKIRVKFSTTIFGLIPTGKWIDVDDEMEIGIRANQEQWQYIGLSNKSLKLKSTPFKIVLYKSTNKPLLTLKYANTIEQAKQELDSLAKMLQME
ncbi:MAG: hypothetical protein WCS10_06090 [Bacteroidales bacterium]|jgi:hypothetical protein|nr:hypothetical protein [Bacteroidales bacterium]MDD4529642.1 hypothetical protein [Bacteroidales bacterium]MDD4829582.1 hypothetical protein [Bacteroidales bacterium]